jgi:hypothetical protein
MELRKSRLSASIVTVLVVLGALGAVALTASGSAGAAVSAGPASCSVTIHHENPGNDAIQVAINTYPGGTICVGPGVFPEQLTISSSGTTLNGAGPTKTFIEPNAPLTFNAVDYDSTAHATPIAAVILVENTSANQATTGVTIKNLQVDGAAGSSTITSCGQEFVGVDFQNASGTIVSSTVSNIASSNALFGCQPGGLAIYAYNGYYYTNTVPSPSVSVAITRTTVTGYQKNGITCDDLGETCTMASDTVTGIGPTSLTAQNGIQVAYGALASVERSTISDNSYTGTGSTNDWYNTTAYAASGVLLYDPATGTTISHDTVTLNQLGIVYYDDGTLDAGSESIAITHNTVTQSNGYGIVANGAPGSGDSVAISQNTVNNEQSLNAGIWGAPGILVDTGTFTLSHNHILGSQSTSSASNGVNQTICGPSGFSYTCGGTVNITTAAIQGVSGSSSNPTTIILSGTSYTQDSNQLSTVGVDGGIVSVT